MMRLAYNYSWGLLVCIGTVRRCFDTSIERNLSPHQQILDFLNKRRFHIDLKLLAAITSMVLRYCSKLSSLPVTLTGAAQCKRHALMSSLLIFF